MPNTFAFIALFTWPLVMLVLFRAFPIQKALVWSLLAGYLLLPSRVMVNWPMIPAFDKTSIPNVTAAILCLLMARAHQKNQARSRPPNRVGPNQTPEPGVKTTQHPARPRRSRSRIFTILLLVVVLTPFLTVWHNSDVVFAGPRIIAGLRWYDAFSLSAGLLIMIIPFLLGMRFLATPEDHRYLLQALAIAGVCYAFLVLFEVRMSPRLHIWIYGFFPHNWAQHIRGDGFRPIVFLNHGLAVGVFLASAVVASSALWREAAKARIAKHPWAFATVWIVIALFLSRNLGATALAVLFAPMAMYMDVRRQMLAAAIVAMCIVTFPFLRGADLVPTQSILQLASKVDERRARSLEFRFLQEDALLARASEKPIAGWGSWGRNRVYHERTGRDLSITDGAWVIVIGSYGWVGYLGQFGLMALPVILLWRVQRKTQSPFDPRTAGLVLVVALGLVDSVPNDFLGPYFWLTAGALAGRYQALVSGIKASPAGALPVRRRAIRS